MSLMHRRGAALVQDYLTHSADRLGDKVALVCMKQRITYGELESRADALASYLQCAGVARGDRVVVFADNTVEAVVAFWAVLKANAVICMVNPLTKSDKLSYILKDCRPAALITDKHLYPSVLEAARSCPSLLRVIVSGAIGDGERASLSHAIGWDEALAVGREAAKPARKCIDVDLAAIVYTSGSTGEPKGVMLTHANMLAASASIASYLRLIEDEVILNVLPLSFDYGLYQMIMAVHAGARLVLERSFAFPAEVLELIVGEKVTGFPAVPTIFAILADFASLSKYDFSGVRYVTSTAAALPPKHIALLRDTFPNARIYSMYGLTECKRCTYLPPEDLDRKPLSVGIAIPNTEMWIVDERNQRVGAGTVGELVIRGATVMKGYWEKPEATARKLKPGPVPGEQVLYTGDYCHMDSDGYLYFVSRMDDIIKTRGEKVAPKEVESALLDVVGVKEAAVIGIPDKTLGTAIKAFVVLERGVALAEKQLQKECQKRLETFMVPKYIVAVPCLPMTGTGKVKKLSLV